MAPGPWTRRVAALAALAAAVASAQLSNSGKSAASASSAEEFTDVPCTGATLQLKGSSPSIEAVCDGGTPTTLSETTLALSLTGLTQNLKVVVVDPLDGLTSLTIVNEESDHSVLLDFESTFTSTFYALTLRGIDLSSNVSLPVQKEFNYLSISNSNLVNISTANNVSKLTLELKDELTTIPGILYQTNYTDLNLSSLNFDLTNEVALTSLQYYTLEANVGDTNLSTAGVTCSISNGSGTCSATSSSNSGVIGNIFPPTSSTDDNKKSSSSSSSSGSTSTEAGNDDGDGGLSTVLIVVIVIIVVIALALLFFIVRHLRSRRAANSGNNGDDNMATLMSKDDTPAGNIKGSFISNDEFLRTFRIDQSDVSLTKALGTGGLWMGEYQGNKVAIKRIEAEVTSTSVAKQFREQARMFATLSHPNIVSLIGVTWLAGTDFAVVAEFLAKGNLKTLLSNMDIDLDLMAKLQICLDVAQGLAYLHSRERNMCIKALSSRKVLLTSSTECKLNLFDCVSTSVKLDNNVSYPYGTGEIGWLAPEVLTRSVHMDPRKANIFSFGVLVCEVLTRATPYQALIDERGNTLSDVEILKRAKNREQLTPHEGRIEFASAPLSLRQIVNECLSYDAVRRPTADELVVAVQRAQEEARTKSI